MGFVVREGVSVRRDSRSRAVTAREFLLRLITYIHRLVRKRVKPTYVLKALDHEDLLPRVDHLMPVKEMLTNGSTFLRCVQ